MRRSVEITENLIAKLREILKEIKKLRKDYAPLFAALRKEEQQRQKSQNLS